MILTKKKKKKSLSANAEEQAANYAKPFQVCLTLVRAMI